MIVYISVAAVTAAYGSALTAGHFFKRLYGPDTWLTGVRGHGGHFSASQLRRETHHALGHERYHE
ncbi:hypothetical protein EIY72_27650, partial [Pseudomonas vancouverensis]